MSEETKPADAKSWLERNSATILKILALVFSLITGGAIGHECKPDPEPKTIYKETEKHVLVPDDGKPAEDYRFGWVKYDQQIEKNLDPAQTLQFDQTPAGRASLGDDDVFLYRIVRKVNNRGPPWYPNINQGPVGSCVGAASKHGADVVQATAIASGQNFEWKPSSAEVIYATSRVDVGKGQIRGDGSVGVWAWEALQKVGALAPMEKIGTHDLSSYSAARARDWGYKGVPADVKAVSRQHPVKGAAIVKTAADVKRAISQGYPVVVCSDQGFTMTRDARGFASPRGTWPHCMCFIAWRGDRPGALCLNSWGDGAHTGPVWPEDAPTAAFWVDERIVNRMVAQGDSFALADVVGFPARNPRPDWFVLAPKPVKPDILLSEFALKP